MASIFKGGDKVFAKMRGHPAWPARVESIADSSPSNAKYHVLFYGTMQRGICRSNEIFSFAENKEKYGQLIKRKGFKEALDQIEGLSPVPEFVPIIVDEKYRNGFSKLLNNATIVINNNNVTNNIDSPINKKARVVIRKETKIIQAVNPLKNSFEMSDGGYTQMEKQKKTEDTKSQNSLKVEFPASGSGTISRSGRVIKRKSFYDESETSTPKQKRISLKKEKDNTQSLKKLNLPRKQKFTKKLATSQKHAVLKKQTVQNWLATENCLTNLDTLVRSQLSISRANPEQCIRYLDDLKKLDLKPLMLKKHPEVVETIKRLRKYVGNPNAWNFSEEQRKEFDERATHIRQKAEAIFEKFKSMFCTRDSITFLKVFADNVIAFQAKTQNWPLEKVYALTSEPEVNEKTANPEKRN